MQAQPTSPPEGVSAGTELETFAEAMDEFLRAARRARGRLNRTPVVPELSASQFHLLEPLLRAPEALCVGELADAAGVTPPSATRMLDGLQERGLVARVRASDDRRVVRVPITPEGAELVARKQRPRCGPRAPGRLRRADARASAGPRPACCSGWPPRSRTSTRDAGRPRGARGAGRTLAVLALGALAYALAQTMVIPALPAIQRDHRASPEPTTWLLTAFLLTSCVCTPLLGRLGDMFGKERLLLVVAGRVRPRLAGLRARPVDRRPHPRARGPGRGRGDLPARLRDHPRRVPRDRVAPSIGLISATFGIGGGFGPRARRRVRRPPLRRLDLLVLARGRPPRRHGPRWRFVPESPVRARAKIDWAGGALLSPALTALLLGVSQGNAWGWTLGARARPVRRGASSLARLRRLRAPGAEPLVDMRLMRQRAVWTTNLAAFGVGFAMFGSYILIPELVQTPPARRLRLRRAAHRARDRSCCPSALVMLFSGPPAGWLGPRFGSRLPLALGALFAGVAYIDLGLLHATLARSPRRASSSASASAWRTLRWPTSSCEAVRQDQTGVATGINTIMRSIGGAVGAQISASLLAGQTILHGRFPAESGFTGAFLLSGAVALVALLVTALIPRPAGEASGRAVPAVAPEAPGEPERVEVGA